MLKSGAVIACLVMLAIALAPPPAPTMAGSADHRRALSTDTLPTGARVQTFREDLSFPVDMAWVPRTQKIFFTEKNSGKIRVMMGPHLLDRACTRLDVTSSGERGALGLALHPDFKDNRWLYVFFTNADPLENRVVRFTVSDNRCTDRKIIVKGIDASASGYHNGGQLEFIGDKLFVSTGEAHDPAEAQSTDNRLGKILRLNDDGTIPADNPFSRPGAPNPVWSYGHRNPFGLAVNRSTGILYESENGPSCDDEVNLISRGGNYGWGASYECGGEGRGANPIAPLRRWTPPIVPTDLFWYTGRMASLSGSLYMGDFGTGRLHRLVMDESGRRITADRIIYDANDGIVDVSKGPKGWLYFMTPDAIYRIIPR
ncbi:MAG TPA: PQQ-dependent sugar dehydrogenase [Actinomycetota bacterium]|nr:PQQ-dependent sugar dehydrogenase [Actinomycetota bacterium]